MDHFCIACFNAKFYFEMIYSLLCPFGLTKFYVASDYLCNLGIPIFFDPITKAKFFLRFENSLSPIRGVMGTIEQHQVKKSLLELIDHLGHDQITLVIP